MDLVVQSHEELVAALPHVLGFKPEESIVLAPIRGKLPFSRIDMPTDANERRHVINSLRGPYARYARPGAAVAIVCVTEDRRGAELVSQGLATELAKVGLEAPLRIWANDERWMEFNTGEAGNRSAASESRLAAEAVAGGRPQPMQSRASLAESLVGDRGPVAAALPAARAAAENSTAPAERDWALDRLEDFHTDGLRLSDADSSRLLLAMQNTSIRNEVWGTMTRENAGSHANLWSDMTRRAPDDVRAPAATMLGFASWLQGDGAKAWCALDQVPPGQPYSMAALVATALQDGIHPESWEKTRGTFDRGLVDTEVDESFVPRPPARRAGPDTPGPAQRPSPPR